jgi:DNA-binding MarR family transcriptional regulator
MDAKTNTRSALLRAVDDASRKASAQSVILSETVARLAGLNPTDLECLDLLNLAGPQTAGQLAAQTGLTTGAMTAVIDRLEHYGFVKRRDDPTDRRRVLVELLPTGPTQIAPLYEPLAERIGQVLGGFSDRELRIIVRFLEGATAATTEHVQWLQGQPAVQSRRSNRRQPALPREEAGS